MNIQSKDPSVTEFINISVSTNTETISVTRKQYFNILAESTNPEEISNLSVTQIRSEIWDDSLCEWS